MFVDPATPYVCLLLALLLIHAPKLVIAREQARRPEGYDNAHPREQQAQLTGLGARARGAHNNGFEAFAPFAAGVLAAELRHVALERICALAVAFVVLRVIYIGLYLGNVPTARSAVWSLGLGATIALLVMAITG